MKKSIVLLAAFGLSFAIITGSFENSFAEESDSIFQRYTFSSDSSKTLSLQERAKSNAHYLKTDQAQSDNSAGEFVLGGFGALGGGVATAALAYGIRCAIQDGYDAWNDDAGLAEVLAGYLVGSNVGCATTVYLVGRSGGDRGSYSAALGGSLGGTLLGVGGLLITAAVTESPEVSLLVFHAGQAWGATRAFNRSSKAKKNQTSAQALLNLDDAKLTLAFPELTVSPGSFSSHNYQVNLFQATF